MSSLKNARTLICLSHPGGKESWQLDIAKGERVVKYGEPIGVATRDIKAGSHVHVHNVESSRERGDR